MKKYEVCGIEYYIPILNRMVKIKHKLFYQGDMATVYEVKSQYGLVVMKLIPDNLKNNIERELEIARIMSANRVGPLIYESFITDAITRKSGVEVSIAVILMEQLKPFKTEHQLKDPKHQDVYSLSRAEHMQLVNQIKMMHELGYVHNDLKPDNVMLNDKDEIKLIDFGLATPVEDNEDMLAEELELPLGRPIKLVD